MPDNFDYKHLLTQPLEYLDEQQRQWLRPPGSMQRAMRWILYYSNRFIMRLLFRTRATGLEHLPQGAVVLCPNHTSSLDPAAILAVLDRQTAFRLRWAGRRGAVLANPVRRFGNRLAGTVPVERDLTALAVAGAVLDEGHVLGWFPEGTRTTTGELQPFKPGIGMILYQLRVPAVPVYVLGAYDAWPPTNRWPRRVRAITVRFGKPLVPDEFIDQSWTDETAIERLTDELRQRVVGLAANVP